MAKSSEGLLGDFRGRIGNVVVYKQNGKTVIRSMPRVKPKKARGKLKEGQDAFAHVVKHLAAVKAFVRIGFREVAENSVAFNRAKSFNLNRYKESKTKVLADWMLLSKGERAGAQDLHLESQDPLRINVYWGAAEEGKLCSPEDGVMLLAIQRENLAVCYDLHAGKRKDGSGSLELTGGKPGGVWDVFISFRAWDADMGKRDVKCISDSQWVLDVLA